MAIAPLRFVEKHGVVLASAKGPVPNLAEAIAGEPIRGSWWGHPKGQQIFRALSALDGSNDVRCFRLIDGKITFVHRRLFPALVRLAKWLGKARLAVIRQEHTASGAHRTRITAFPAWVTADIAARASQLSEEEARGALGAWVPSVRAAGAEETRAAKPATGRPTAKRASATRRSTAKRASPSRKA